MQGVSKLSSTSSCDEPPTSNSAKVDNTKLMYIGHNITRIPEVFWKIHGPTIEHLDLSYNIIHNLNGLEHFALLTDLILDNNSLGDSLEFPTLMPRLRTLSLNKNRINDLTAFIRKVKRSCPNIEFLSLLGNRACPNELSDITKDEADYQRYRYYVLHHLRTLKFLDSAPVTKQELQEAVRRGQFMQIKKPKPYSQQERPQFLTEDTYRCTPLPPSGKTVGDHKGAYTTYKSRYTNRDSEGNRFIVNSDL